MTGKVKRLVFSEKHAMDHSHAYVYADRHECIREQGREWSKHRDRREISPRKMRIIFKIMKRSSYMDRKGGKTKTLNYIYEEST